MIRKTLGNGKELTVETTSADTWRVAIDGHVTEGAHLNRLPKTVIAGGTRVDWVLPLAKGAVGLTEAEGSQLMAEANEFRNQSAADLRSDPEWVAWQKIQDAEEQADYWYRRAFEGRASDDDGSAYRKRGEAETALTAAKAAYLAEFGETGKHWAASGKIIAREEARRKADYERSFIARGLD